jgi:hypothetical protein
MTDAPSETLIGSEQVALPHVLQLSVCPDLSVRVRIRGADGQLLVDIATTTTRLLTPIERELALHIAVVFQLAAERAEPVLVAKLVKLGLGK